MLRVGYHVCMRIIYTKEDKAFFKAKGSEGGNIGAAKMTPEQRSERARKAAAVSAIVRKKKSEEKKAK